MANSTRQKETVTVTRIFTQHVARKGCFGIDSKRGRDTRREGRRQKACSYVLAYLPGASQLDEGNLIAKPVRFYDRFLPGPGNSAHPRKTYVVINTIVYLARGVASIYPRGRVGKSIVERKIRQRETTRNQSKSDDIREVVE